jgi:hypothetical protein
MEATELMVVEEEEEVQLQQPEPQVMEATEARA